MEWIQIVDEFNHPIGCGTRQFVHQQQLRHRACHLVFTNAAQEILLQQRTFSKDTFPGCWDTSVGGHVEIGESYLACLLRESEEELGIKPGAPQLFRQEKATKENGWEFVHLYHEVLSPDLWAKIQYNQEEIMTLQWFSLKELDNLILENAAMFTPTLRNLLPYF